MSSDSWILIYLFSRNYEVILKRTEILEEQEECVAEYTGVSSIPIAKNGTRSWSMNLLFK